MFPTNTLWVFYLKIWPYTHSPEEELCLLLYPVSAVLEGNSYYKMIYFGEDDIFLA